MNKQQQLEIRNILFEVITAAWPQDPHKITPQQMYQAKCVLDKAAWQFNPTVRYQCSLSQLIWHVYDQDIDQFMTMEFMDQMGQHRTLDLLKHTA